MPLCSVQGTCVTGVEPQLVGSNMYCTLYCMCTNTSWDAHSPTNLTLILFWVSEVDDIAEVCGSFLVALELFFEQVCIPSELSHHSK